MRRFAAILIVASLGGCATYVPVAAPKLKVPAECNARHYSDLPKLEELPGATASPEAVTKHFAADYRLKQRKEYRRLYRNYKVCSRYASGV